MPFACCCNICNFKHFRSKICFASAVQLSLVWVVATWWRRAPGSWWCFGLSEKNPKSSYLSVEDSKRHCFKHWSPWKRCQHQHWSFRTRSTALAILRWHEGELFAAHFNSKSTILCWKPGDPATCVRRVGGEGATVAGINDLRACHSLAISREAGRCSCQIRRIGGFFVFKMVLGT